jgi:hypothetical protein
VEIECEPKNSPRVIKKLNDILSIFVQKLTIDMFQILESIKSKNYYVVTGTVGNVDIKGIREFEKVTINREVVYALLINSYKKMVVLVK